MLKSTERRIFFAILCIAVLLSIYGEYVLFQEPFSLWHLILLFVPGGVIAGSSKIFLKVISQSLLELGLTPSRLHEFSSERAKILADARTSREDEYTIRARLVTNTLKFAERWLSGWVPGTHLEFCVFVDRNTPLMFAYFDSKKDNSSRSKADRERDPAYYVKKGYAVTRLLAKPTSEIVVIPDTACSSYFFASAHQSKQIKSTILLCPDVNQPCALVLTSNKKNAFREDETEVLTAARYFAETVYCDLIEEDFLNRIPLLRPDLFPGR